MTLHLAEAATMSADEFTDARKRLHLTQAQMGDVIGVSVTQIKRFEAAEATIPQRSADVVRFLADGRWPDAWPEASKPAVDALTDEALERAIGDMLMRIGKSMVDG